MKNLPKTVKEMLVKGTDTGFKDYLGNPYLIGSLVEYFDSEGFTCSTELVVRDNFSIGIDGWDRRVDIDEMSNSEKYRVIKEWK